MARAFDLTWSTPTLTGGLAAGVTFLAFEMLNGAVQSGAAGFWMPLRMTSAIALGPLALHASYPIAAAAVTGLLIHLLLSIVIAVIFVAMAQPQPTLTLRPGLLVASTLFGLGLWIVNFYVLAPTLGWYWFPDQTNPWIQCLAHTFFYGSVLGAYLSRHLEPSELPTVE